MYPSKNQKSEISKCACIVNSIELHCIVERKTKTLKYLVCNHTPNRRFDRRDSKALQFYILMETQAALYSTSKMNLKKKH